MNIREAEPEELEISLQVERAAFGGDEGANLVYQMARDSTAQPMTSLLAFDAEMAVGHILFTPVSLDGVRAQILCPLAVIPDRQKQGVGKTLIREGLRRLQADGVDLVFVLGDPEYYGRFGFVPAYPQGLPAPFPHEPDQQPAWMVQPLREDLLGAVSGTIRVCDALNHPFLWEF